MILTQFPNEAIEFIFTYFAKFLSARKLFTGEMSTKHAYFTLCVYLFSRVSPTYLFQTHVY